MATSTILKGTDMANITSSTYPVVTDSETGDQYAIVRNGQLKKQTRTALMEQIAEQYPGSFLNLSDVDEGTYVGNQGKVPMVNASEDGLEFVASDLAGNFITLADTPESYGTAGYLVKINSSGNGLEFGQAAFLNLSDVDIASFSDSAGYLLRVNSSEDGIELAPIDVTKRLYGGFLDYNHSGTAQAYTSGDGYVKLLNDAGGSQTNKDYPSPNVTDLWNTSTNLFDWTELKLGDQVNIRIDLQVVTTSTNQEVEIDLYMANGSGSEYSIPFAKALYKTAGTQSISRFNGIYMGNATTLNNSAYFRIYSDSDATITVTGWYMQILERGA